MADAVDISDAADKADAVSTKAKLEAETAAALVTKLKVDPAVALRFSRARQGNLAKAEAFLAADLKWREETKPEATAQADIMRALPSGCWRLLGTIAESRMPVLFINLALWNPNDYDVDEYGRYVIYFLEAMGRLGERFIVIFDTKWKLSHGMQMRKVKRLINVLQDHYPERLERALLMRAPAIFASAWAIIKGFTDPVTAAKVSTRAGIAPL